jgi:polyisoprenoid-binding protein YceI
VEQFRIVPGESLVAIYARSNVGPIRWEGTNLRGGFKAAVSNSSLDLHVQPVGRLDFPLEYLTSGNALYDAELMRRLDARQYPVTVAELRFLDTLNQHNRYQVQGSLTLHGVTRSITGSLAVQFDDETFIQVFGEKVIDIRDFNIPSPSMLMLKIYPDVRVRLKLVAERTP